METMDSRRDSIVKFINEKGNISFAQLKKAFPNVSEMTLRTDLKALDEEKRIVRVHGGAKSVNVVIGTDDLFGRRAVRNIDAKQIIVDKALKLVQPHTTIFLDSGSTTTLLARSFPDIPSIIFTSGLSCASELAKLTQPQVMIPGGRMNRYSMSVTGLETIQNLERVNFDIAFIGVTCYSRETGFTCGASEEAALKRAAMMRAEKKIILMDTSKIGTRSTFSICDLQDIDAVISESALPEEMMDFCSNGGIQVY